VKKTEGKPAPRHQSQALDGHKIDATNTMKSARKKKKHSPFEGSDKKHKVPAEKKREGKKAHEENRVTKKKQQVNRQCRRDLPHHSQSRKKNRIKRCQKSGKGKRKGRTWGRNDAESGKKFQQAVE